MFNVDSWSTIRESVLETADSVLETAGSTTGSSANIAKTHLWVWVFKGTSNCLAEFQKT